MHYSISILDGFEPDFRRFPVRGRPSPPEKTRHVTKIDVSGSQNHVFWYLIGGIWAWDLAHELDHPFLFFVGLNESSGGLK